MKVRHLCAVLGVAMAVGIVVFMQSLVATNDHQALSVAERLLKAVPVDAQTKVAHMALDYRPGGRVMQGPPMAVTMAIGGARMGECIVTRALFAQRRLPVPPIGTELKFVGRRGVHTLRLAEVIDWDKPLRGYPNVFVAVATSQEIAEEWVPWKPQTAAELAPGFRSQAGHDLDRAKMLLLWASALTALCLLVNTLFLSVEARRRDLALLRTLGLARVGVVQMVLSEAALLTLMGLLVGIGGALAALWAFVACESAAFPAGPAVSGTTLAVCVLVAPLVAALAALLALRPALAVRPLEAASARLPRKRPLGMLIAFACGFGSFVAVEVWGASLMRSFVPSPEWPDAIVSILPAGISSFEIEKLQGKVNGVARLHELVPLQVNFDPLEVQPEKGAPAKFGRGEAYRNALLLGSDYLPEFRFVAGDYASATNLLNAGDNCVITEMMARARKLKQGDTLHLDCGRGQKAALKIVGIVDLNWHMVTSRALVRGLNRKPKNTDGPVFVSFDTLEGCDLRPSAFVRMTHVWLDFDRDFLRTNGVFAAGRQVEKRIVEALGGAFLETEEGEVLGNTVRLHSRDEVADGTLAHGWDIIGTMARIPLVFILVISIGFVAMLVASSESRQREFAVLRAVGATTGQMARILFGEAFRVAILGVLVGLLGGALVGWLATSGTRAAMATWGIPPSFAVPALTLLKGAAEAVGFALLVSIPTSLILIRRRVRR